MAFLHWVAHLGYLDQFVSGLSTWAVVLTLFVSIFILTKAAGWMVTGGVALARLTALPEIIIGATIISLGTTLPEVFVSVLSAWTGNPGLALGNGIGAIICNTGLVLGVTCIFTRVPVDHFLLNRAGLVLTGAGSLIVLFSVQAYMDAPNQPVLHRWVGVVFLILLAGYLYLSYQWSRKEKASGGGEQEHRRPKSISATILLTMTGLAGVIFGSRLLIPCAAVAATRMGVPEDVVASTIVALGTSLPELATAVVAIRKGHPQIMVGNVVGADILSCLFVIGAATMASPLHVPPDFFRFHFPVMLLILYSFHLFVSFNRDGWFKRGQGAWILCVYLAYVVLQYRFAF